MFYQTPQIFFSSINYEETFQLILTKESTQSAQFQTDILNTRYFLYQVYTSTLKTN